MDIAGVNGSVGLPVSAPGPAAPDPVKQRDLLRAVNAVNATDLLGANELSFSLDRNTRLPVIRVVNKQTKEVVEQIPPESVLSLAEELPQPGL